MVGNQVQRESITQTLIEREKILPQFSKISLTNEQLINFPLLRPNSAQIIWRFEYHPRTDTPSETSYSQL